jgi:predicted permease
MFKYNLKIAWRNLIKDKKFKILNLTGFATGMAATFLIGLWIADELNTDKYNKKDASIYQVMQNIRQSDGIETMEYTAGLLPNALKSDFPEVEYAASVVPAYWFTSPAVVSFNDTRLRAKPQFVSKDFFNIFTCRFVHGNPNSMLANKNAVAISDELAMKLFSTTTGVIGKTLSLALGEFNGNYYISSIFEKNPANQHDKFDMLLSFDLFVEKRPGMLSWGNSDPSTFLILKKGTDVAQFNEKIRHFITKKDKEAKKEYFVRRFSDKYLHDQYKDGIQSGGRIVYVRLFTFIAIFILVIACINFMNLSTAKATRRIKEVGVQKVVGANRSSLIFQYLSESVLMSLIALAMSVLLMALLLPAFNNITGKSITMAPDITMIVAALGVTIATGLLAGVYPALYISSFRPVLILKGKLKRSAGELIARRGLVVFQFALSAAAIVAVLVVYWQIQFIQSKNLGYNRDNVVHFEIPLELQEAKINAAVAFVEELKKIPGVVSAGSYSHNLTGDHGGIGGFQWPGKDPNMDINFANLEVGSGFLETMGIKIKDGRYFSQGVNAQNEIVFNETAIKNMGLKDPIGKTVQFWDRKRQIVGIAEDFNFESLYQGVKSCFFQVYPVCPNAVVRIKAGTEKQTLASIAKSYDAFTGGLVFDYRFMDEDVQALYVSENRIAVLSRYFAGLAILISCLGLFGMTAFSAQTRQKEIGIRKVLGANAGSIAVMLSKDSLKWVALSILIAFPVAAWWMNEWLNNFAYRTQLSGNIFIIAAISVFVISILTVCVQTIRAAIANPVNSLRSE